MNELLAFLSCVWVGRVVERDQEGISRGEIQFAVVAVVEAVFGSNGSTPVARKAREDSREIEQKGERNLISSFHSTTS